MHWRTQSVKIPNSEAQRCIEKTRRLGSQSDKIISRLRNVLESSDAQGHEASKSQIQRLTNALEPTRFLLENRAEQICNKTALESRGSNKVTTCILQMRGVGKCSEAIQNSHGQADQE